MFAGKALAVDMRDGELFLDPMVPQPFVFQHKTHMRESVKYLLIDVVQVYRLYIIWELALNSAMGIKRI